MKDTAAPFPPSLENVPGPPPSTNPSASAAPVAKVPSMTLEEWEHSQPHYPFHRVPRTSIAHLFKGCIKGPPSWIIEPARKSARINWVQAFQEAKAGRDAAAAADETEGK